MTRGKRKRTDDRRLQLLENLLENIERRTFSGLTIKGTYGQMRNLPLSGLTIKGTYGQMRNLPLLASRNLLRTLKPIRVDKTQRPQKANPKISMGRMRNIF